MNDFRDLVSVVTGGCSGIGAATASLMTQRGAKVAILDRDIRQPSERWALGLQCDVGASSSVGDAVRAVSAGLGASTSS
jgi:2-keto-3-deoxy-L-fuconate dehydrogenase